MARISAQLQLYLLKRTRKERRVHYINAIDVIIQNNFRVKHMNIQNGPGMSVIALQMLSNNEQLLKGNGARYFFTQGTKVGSKQAHLCYTRSAFALIYEPNNCNVFQSEK